MFLMATIFLANYVLLPVDCHGEITKNLSSFWHAKVLRVKRNYILFLIIIGDIAASTILKNEPPEFLETLKQWISFKTLKRCIVLLKTVGMHKFSTFNVVS